MGDEPRRKEDVVTMAKRMIKTQGMKQGIQTPGSPCLYADADGTAIPKICIHGYECWHCAFDQWVGEMEERQMSSKDFNIKREFLAKPHKAVQSHGEGAFM